MPKISLMNMAWGFTLIFVAACGGVFVALNTTELFIRGPVQPEWQALLQTASHGHVTLFGVIHVLLGLTIPYTRSSAFENRLKSIGIGLGSLAMGPLLLVRAVIGPTLSTELNGVLIGVCLSCALFAIVYHALGIMLKIGKRV
ncbi:MAG: hypothetical protein WCL28_04135 [bacterium]